MNKKIFALFLVLTLIFLGSCSEKKDNENNEKDNTQLSGAQGSSDEYVFKGKVSSLENRNCIEMEIIDSDIAFGTYWVLVSNETLYFDNNGNATDQSAIKVGDIIEVVFSGQVMNSFPPKISARKIYIK